MLLETLLTKEHFARTGIFTGSSAFGLYALNGGIGDLTGHPLLILLYLIATGILAPALMSVITQLWKDRKETRHTQDRQHARAVEAVREMVEQRDRSREAEVKLFIDAIEQMTLTGREEFVKTLAALSSQNATVEQQLKDTLARLSDCEDRLPRES
jgi:hypothetical protein